MIDEVIAFHRFWDLGPLANSFGELVLASCMQCVRDEVNDIAIAQEWNGTLENLLYL